MNQIPARRFSINEKITHRSYTGADLPVIITVGVYKGRVREVFTSSFKTGSDTNALSSDGCILISTLMRHGYTPDQLLQKLSDPPSLLGSILKACAEIDRSCLEDLGDVSYVELNGSTTMDKEFRLTTASYRLNPLVNLAKDARQTEHIGQCKACGSPVSLYNPHADVVAHRPAAGLVFWAACDNADCQHAEGEAHGGTVEWIDHNASSISAAS